MCNNEAPSTSSTTTNLGQIIPADPEMSDVLKTLRILSRASLARKNAAAAAGRMGHYGSSRCTNCNGMFQSLSRSTGPPRSREEILRNLTQLEVALSSKGEKLPGWVKAYKDGDSLMAAKLLHMSYQDRIKARTATKRPVEVAPATSTTEGIDAATKEEESNDQNLNPPGSKRRRLVSAESSSGSD